MAGQAIDGLTLVCNDLGEVEQVIHDGFGLPLLEDGKPGKAVFLRLVERTSLDAARAFLTDLRINHKVTDRQLSIRAKDGSLNALFAGVKAGSQFILVAAKTAEVRDKLFAEVLATVNEHIKFQPYTVTRPLRTRPHVTKTEKAEAERPPETLKSVRAELAKAREELEKVREDFYALATIDTITGLYNRRHFIKRLREELREAERYKRSPSLLVVDIDDLSDVNEKYGLQAGDELIRSVGEIIQGVLRKVDMVGRIGGDEFGALLIETTTESSLRVSQRLQKKLTGVAIEIDGRTFHVSVSIALVHTGDGKGVTADNLLKRAEKLLQKAKDAGGNQIVQE